MTFAPSGSPMAYYPKVAIREVIPTSFADFMKQVAKLIEEGDEATTLESDDLLQTDNCCGGLDDPVRQIFTFSFFPGTPEDATEWQIALKKPLIKSIADGTLTVLEMWRCPNCNGANRYSSTNAYCQNCDDPREALERMATQ